MASEVNDVIEDYMRSHKSPIELQKDVEARYGADAEEKMSLEEAREVYNEIFGWTYDHNIVMQDSLIKQCGDLLQWSKADPKAAVKKMVATLKTMADHLAYGQELGLNEAEQIIIDSLYSQIPHNYEPNYLVCANQLYGEILRMMPPDSEDRTFISFFDFFSKFVKKATELAAKNDVDFDTSDYSLTMGYLFEFLRYEYDVDIENPWGEF